MAYSAPDAIAQTCVSCKFAALRGLEPPHPPAGRSRLHTLSAHSPSAGERPAHLRLKKTAVAGQASPEGERASSCISVRVSRPLLEFRASSGSAVLPCGKALNVWKSRVVGAGHCDGPRATTRVAPTTRSSLLLENFESLLIHQRIALDDDVLVCE